MLYFVTGGLYQKTTFRAFQSPCLPHLANLLYRFDLSQ